MLMFGLFATAGFLVLYFFITSFIAPPVAQTNNETTNIVNALQLASDPLVTVVPAEILGGVPHMLATDPRRGKDDAKVTIIEFGDYQCEACAAMNDVMQQIMEQYSDRVQHVWKDFPIPTLHPQSEMAARAAHCAGSQGKFWEMHDILFENQKLFPVNPWIDLSADALLANDAFTQCMEAGETRQKVIEGYYIARALSLDSTPVYFINGQKLSGAQTFADMQKVIEEELQNTTSQ